MAMAQSKPSSSSKASGSSDGRRRVVKACQRCRLKKCKVCCLLDRFPIWSGFALMFRSATVRHHAFDVKPTMLYAHLGRQDSPTRCFIEAGTNRMVQATYRILMHVSYVSMLERQQSQLVAGIQELYRRVVDNEQWPHFSMDDNLGINPPTHRILERLGVLTGNWDEADHDIKNLNTTHRSSFDDVVLDALPQFPQVSPPQEYLEVDGGWMPTPESDAACNDLLQLDRVDDAPTIREIAESSSMRRKVDLTPQLTPPFVYFPTYSQSNYSPPNPWIRGTPGIGEPHMGAKTQEQSVIFPST